MNRALLNLPHLRGIPMYETSVSHLDNPASVGVHILENNGKVNYFETRVF